MEFKTLEREEMRVFNVCARYKFYMDVMRPLEEEYDALLDEYEKLEKKCEEQKKKIKNMTYRLYKSGCEIDRLKSKLEDKQNPDSYYAEKVEELERDVQRYRKQAQKLVEDKKRLKAIIKRNNLGG